MTNSAYPKYMISNTFEEVCLVHSEDEERGLRGKWHDFTDARFTLHRDAFVLSVDDDDDSTHDSD